MMHADLIDEQDLAGMGLLEQVDATQKGTFAGATGAAAAGSRVMSVTSSRRASQARWR